MKRSKEEAEVVVRLDYLTQTVHICVAQWPAMAAKMERLYGKSLDGQSEMSRRWSVPLRSVSFRRPKSGRSVGSAKASPSVAISPTLTGFPEQEVPS
jgi:hypothetical protein